MIDTNTIERISPEYWRNSQLSIARFYGSAIIQGKRYVIDRATDELVREDVYNRDKRTAKEAEKEFWQEIQDSLI